LGRAASVPEVIRDEARLRALREQEILDTEPEPAFDRIVRLATDLLDAPIGLLNFVGADRQFFKSKIGFAEREIGLDVSFCVHTIDERAPMVVEDAAADERFADNPYVAEGTIRFYAGVPVEVGEAPPIGTICVMDEEPRALPDDQVDRLTDLAAMVEDELELRRETLRRRAAEQRSDTQNAFLESIAVGAETSEVLTELCRHTERQLPGARVSILRLEGDRLRHAAGPSLPDDYLGAVDGLRIGPAAATCGTAAHTGQDVITEDVLADERWEGYRELAEAAGIRSCWSTPIQGSTGDVLGTFAIYGAEPWTPNEREQDLLRWTGHVASVALERNRRERTLRETEERYRRLVDHFPGAVYLYDEDCRCVLAGGKALDAAGLSVEEVVGDTPRERYPTEIAEPLLEALRAALRGETTTLEQSYQERDYRVETLPVQEGETCMAVALDITKRVQTRNELREERDLLHRIFETSPAAIVVFNTDGAFIEATGRAEEILGLSKEAVTDRTYNDPKWQIRDLDGDPIPDEELPFARVMATEEPLYDAEHWIVWPDGTWRLLSDSGAPLYSADGELEGAVFHIEDITERRRAKQELVAAKEKAEAADRIKTTLLSNMNHELRTPLTSILTFGRLIEQNPGEADPFIDRVLGGGRRLLYTLNTVMEFAELEGEIDPEGASDPGERCQLDGTVRSVANHYRQRAQQNDVALEVEVDKAGTVRLEPRLVERVLTHLLHNAVKFTDEGEIHVSATTQDEAVELEVHDTGVGIDPAFLPHVYDEFAQASVGLDRTYEGNGLGLTVTKRLVDRAGGDIDIESEPGAGTWVTVRLPFASSEGGD
jgi:PAS domain S-box-containing protein